VAVLFTPQALTLFAHRRTIFRRLTFELSGRQRQATRPGPVKMDGVPQARAWWPAVGAPLERGVRHQFATLADKLAFHRRVILPPAQRFGKSSRGTPRLRRPPRI
jgi:hypothetical protein